jgi:hypothetical protein
MIKIPLFVVYAIVALNITAFTILLQMDWLIINSFAAKITAWAASIGAWHISYLKRNKIYFLKI